MAARPAAAAPAALSVGRPAAHHAAAVRAGLAGPGRRRCPAARSRPAAGSGREARHHAAGGGGTPGLAADAVPAARHPDAGAQPAGAARGSGRTRRPAAASRARGPQTALPHGRRRRLAGRGARRAAGLGLERALSPAHVPPDHRLRGGDGRPARCPAAARQRAHRRGRARLRPRPRRSPGRLDVPGCGGAHGRRLPRGAAARRAGGARHALCRQAAQQPRPRSSGRAASQAPAGTAAGRAAAGFHEMEYQAGPWSRPRRVVLVVKERPDDLLLDHFWLLTSFSAAAMPAEDLLAHYRQRGTAEGHFGELMDVLAPALSSAPRTKSRYRDNPLPALPTGIDAAARNEAILLLHLLAYELMHAGRRAMELATHTGWSLRRFRERVLRVGGRVLLHARRVTLVIAQTAAGFWSALWPRFERFPWAGT